MVSRNARDTYIFNSMYFACFLKLCYRVIILHKIYSYLHIFSIKYLCFQYYCNIEIQNYVHILLNTFYYSNPNKPKKINFDWKPLQSIEKMEYMDIGSQLQMKKHLGQRSKFWGKMPLWHNGHKQRLIDEL